MPSHNNLLTRKQVAEYFCITYPTLKRLIDNGNITAYKLGKRRIYFKSNEIDSFLKVVDIAKREVTNG